MNNGNENFLQALKRDLEIYKDTLKEVSMEIIANHISNYPIFVAHTDPIYLGRPVINHEVFGTTWDVNASMLEEFVKRGLVQPSKVDDFKKIYKDPKLNACVFVVSGEEANFVFLPYSAIEH